ncbi:hypothetical protein SD77_2551 [Bacillus badius]|uniref:Uncharacterized protein n=1 Tax=Bacillus badius TaxID=1455 RepID=A0ABR5AZF7_BACBA|nr:hypothetical protein SD77_2551 [Bacillus badius]
MIDVYRGNDEKLIRAIEEIKSYSKACEYDKVTVVDVKKSNLHSGGRFLWAGLQLVLSPQEPPLSSQSAEKNPSFFSACFNFRDVLNSSFIYVFVCMLLNN